MAIGGQARVRDPFGKMLVIPDQSKGNLAADANGLVIWLRPSWPD